MPSGKGQASRAVTAALLAVAVAGAARAGPSLEQAIDRHRALLDTPHDNPFARLGTGPEGITAVLGGPADAQPYLTGPALPGRGGVRVAVTAPPSTGGGPTMRLALRWHPDARRDASFDGTSLSVPVGPGEAYASVEPRHWGPGWVGSLVLDAAAPGLAAIGWRKTGADPFATRWLSWLGPWNADLFVGRLAGHTEPERPRLIGLRLQLRPLAGLELGASRVMQWGGRGRDEGWRSFGRAVLGRDNDGADRSDPGNQLAGLDVRWSTSLGGNEASVYGQLVGEDEAGGLPSARLALFGADWAMRRAGADGRVFVEWADLVAGSINGRPRPGVAYRHHTYRAGYVHDGLPLGHPVGGDARLASAGALFDRGRTRALLALHRGRALEAAQRFEPGSTLTGLNAAASFDVERSSRIGVSWWLWRAGEQRHNALQAWWHTAWR